MAFCDCPSGRAATCGEPVMDWYLAAHSLTLPDMSLNPHLHGEREVVLAAWEAAKERRAAEERASEARMAEHRRELERAAWWRWLLDSFAHFASALWMGTCFWYFTVAIVWMLRDLGL